MKNFIENYQGMENFTCILQFYLKKNIIFRVFRAQIINKQTKNIFMAFANLLKIFLYTKLTRSP